MYLLYKRIYNIHLPIDLQLKLNILKYKQLLCHENVAILKRLSLFALHIIKSVC